MKLILSHAQKMMLIGVAYSDWAANPPGTTWPRTPAVVTSPTVPLFLAQHGGRRRLGDINVARGDHAIRTAMPIPATALDEWRARQTEVPLMACEFGHNGLLTHLLCVLLVPRLEGRTDHLSPWTIAREEDVTL